MNKLMMKSMLGLSLLASQAYAMETVKTLVASAPQATWSFVTDKGNWKTAGIAAGVYLILGHTIWGQKAHGHVSRLTRGNIQAPKSHKHHSKPVLQQPAAS